MKKIQTILTKGIKNKILKILKYWYQTKASLLEKKNIKKYINNNMKVNNVNNPPATMV
jgi:hypothetical protein